MEYMEHWNTSSRFTTRWEANLPLVIWRATGRREENNKPLFLRGWRVLEFLARRGTNHARVCGFACSYFGRTPSVVPQKSVILAFKFCLKFLFSLYNAHFLSPKYVYIFISLSLFPMHAHLFHLFLNSRGQI